MAERRIEVSVADSDAGGRLDRWLADAVDDMSRSRVQALIAEGRLARRDGNAVVDPSRKVRAGETFVLTVPPPAPARPGPEDIPLDVLYEDADLIVLMKPAGLVVHPAAGHATGTLVNALLHHCRGSLSGIGGVTRPGIVHRLDKDTSGVMVCAKSDVAHRGLVEQFQDHSIDRAYMAVVWGVPTPKSGRVENYIGRDPRNRKRMAVVTKGGKRAVTDYRVIRTVGSLTSLVDCQLFTGRTHQIRVQMSDMGYPLVGDPLYQGRRAARYLKNAAVKQALAASNNQALHAYRLSFRHPVTGDSLAFDEPISCDLNKLITSLEEI